jgi:hypothetical protein
VPAEGFAQGEVIFVNVPADVEAVAFESLSSSSLSSLFGIEKKRSGSLASLLKRMMGLN